MNARAARSSFDAGFSSGERWLTVDELAELLGVSRDFVYQHARELGGRRLGTGPKAPWRFRLDDVLAATSSGDVLPGEQASSPAAVRLRRRSSGTSVPLLPIREVRGG